MGVDGNLDRNSTSEVTAAANITQGATVIGADGAKGIEGIGPGTDGQLFLGATGADPAWASAASADGSVTFTEGTNTLDAALSDRNRITGPEYYNFGIAYSAGTFTIKAGDGNDLSATNPGYIILPSKSTPGQFTHYTVTANQNFIDDAGSSEILNNLFGLTTSVAYGEDVPFFIYAVTNDDENAIQFMISRIPHLRTSPAAANIGAPDDAVADAQGDFWSLDNIDETLYDSNPCVCIGSFRMQMSASDDWTVQTLDNQDGIGQFQEGRDFTFPLAVFGASSGTYIRPNTGTAPTFTTNVYTYRIFKTGMVNITIDLNGNTVTDGSGAVITQMTIPYIPVQVNDECFGSYYLNAPGSGAEVGVAQVPTGGGVNYVSFRGEAGDIALNGDFSDGNREWHISMDYKISS